MGRGGQPRPPPSPGRSASSDQQRGTSSTECTKQLRFLPANSGSGLQTWGMEDMGSLSGLGPLEPPGSSCPHSAIRDAMQKRGSPFPLSLSGRRRCRHSRAGEAGLSPSPATCVPFSDKWACGGQTPSGRGVAPGPREFPAPPEGEDPPRLWTDKPRRSGPGAGRGRCAPWWLILHVPPGPAHKAALQEPAHAQPAPPP